LIPMARPLKNWLLIALVVTVSYSFGYYLGVSSTGVSSSGVQNTLLRSVTSVFYAPSVTPTSSQSTTATATQSISTTATATYTPSSTGSVLPSASYSPTVPPSTTPTAAPSVTPTPSPDSYSVTPTPSPSFFDARLSPRHWQKPTTGPSNDTVLIVVAMSSTSGLNWLQQQPFPFVVMTKGAPAGTPNNLEINRGREVPSYAQFIVEHYDNLPKKMVFAHGHETSWHLKNMTALLYVLDVDSYEYVGLSSGFIRHPGFCGVPAYVEGIQRFFNTSGLADFTGTSPSDCHQLEMMCCATFLVTRERILARPKAFWDLLLKYSYENDVGYSMEWSWHFVMGEPWKDEEPDPKRLCPASPDTCKHGIL